MDGRIHGIVDGSTTEGVVSIIVDMSKGELMLIRESPFERKKIGDGLEKKMINFDHLY